VCRLTKKRRLNGHAVRPHRRPPSWAECGWLRGGLKVRVVRYGTKYDAPKRLTLSAPEVRRLYRWRAQVEAGLRVCQEQRGRSGGRARSARAQQHPISGGRAAFWVLAWARHDRPLSIYQLKRCLRFQGRSVALPALERLRAAA
jgi:hypothetical protein